MGRYVDEDMLESDEDVPEHVVNRILSKKRRYESGGWDD